jgi:uncharacterized protein with HEPN domain
MQRDEKSYLYDILMASRRIVRFLDGLTETAFEASELHQSAVARELMLIGEAARFVSQETRDLHPDIKWSAMAGMRNWLAHAYTVINWKIVWETARDDIPRLIDSLEKLNLDQK